LINTTCFSAVASQTFDSVFTTTYDTYLIDVIFTASQSNTVVNMNLRSSAPADLTGTNFYRLQQTYIGNAVTASQSQSNTVWGVSPITGSADRQNNRITIVISNLADAAFKFGYSIGNTQDGVGLPEGTLRFFNYNNAGAAAGMKLAIGAGTFTGVGRIYGYQK
jgi:hypothetical protein